MSKTLGSILKFGSIGFLAIVTGGIGLGLAGGLSLGASFAGVAGALGVSTTSLVGGALVGISSVASLFAPGAPKPAATETAIKSPTPDRISAYGRSRLYGAYMLYMTASNATACDAYAIHDGQIDGYEIYYLGDKRVATSPGIVAGLPDGTYKSPTVEIDSRIGLPTETAFSQLIAMLPGTWTEDHRGDGIATAMVTWKEARTKDYQEIYPNGQPPLSVAARWQLAFDWRDPSQDVTDPTTWKWSENAILHIAHYQLVRNNKDWATHFVPTLAYWTAAANDADIAVPLKGVQAILTSDAADDGVHTLELSTVNGLTVGATIVISATGDTSLAETRIVGAISGLTVTITVEIDNFHPQGSQVTWSSAGGSPASEPRYRSCVAHKHTDAHKDVLANLLACCDGWMAPRSDGALVIYSGRYYAPTVTIGPDQITGYSLQDGVAEESALNQISVTYVSANHDFSTVETDAWEDTDDIDSRGKVLSDTLSNQVPTHSQGRRLAKRKMSQVMAPFRGTVTTNAAGRAVIGQRFIHLQLIDAGTTFYDGPAEITKLTRNLATGGVTFDWIAADPNIDAWNPATEEGEPAPVGNRVATMPLDVPVIASAIFFGSDNSGSGTPGARVRITATGPDRTDLTWFARWRVVGATAWNEQQYSDTDPGVSVILETGFVPVDADIEVEVAYQVGDGRVSPYSDPPFEVPTGSITADSSTITADTTGTSSDRT